MSEDRDLVWGGGPRIKGLWWWIRGLWRSLPPYSKNLDTRKIKFLMASYFSNAAKVALNGVMKTKNDLWNQTQLGWTQATPLIDFWPKAGHSAFLSISFPICRIKVRLFLSEGCQEVPHLNLISSLPSWVPWIWHLFCYSSTHHTLISFFAAVSPYTLLDPWRFHLIVSLASVSGKGATLRVSSKKNPGRVGSRKDEKERI